MGPMSSVPPVIGDKKLSYFTTDIIDETKHYFCCDRIKWSKWVPYSIDFVAHNTSLAGAASTTTAPVVISTKNCLTEKFISDNQIEKKTKSTTTPVIHTYLTDKILNLNLNINLAKEKREKKPTTVVEFEWCCCC